MANKNKIATIGLLAVGGALVANELSKGGTNRSANLIDSLKTNVNTVDSAELIKLIESSPTLKEYLKRVAESTQIQNRFVTVENGQNIRAGATTPDNATGNDTDFFINTTTSQLFEKVSGVWTFRLNMRGSNGNDGLNAPNFGGSLLVNGAGEFNNLSGWPSTGEIIGIRKGFPIIRFSGIGNRLNNNSFLINTDRIYKINVDLKTVNNVSFFLQRLSIENNPISINNSSQASPIVFNTNNLENFTNRIIYFNVKDNGLRDLGVDTVKARLNIFLSSESSVIEFNRLIIKEVDLGESVPSNLPWLPTGQEVHDPTTGDRGRFNGTTIDWYQMI
jgi:hypothetical protein